MDYQSDIEHALLEFASTFPPYDQAPLTDMSQFSNGLVFAHLLSTVQRFPLTLRELEAECPRLTEKLTNLKTIVRKIQTYVSESSKLVRTKDIDLIQIAKHSSSEHIQRLFELVIAVFMQSPHKEDYIQTIMKLDQRSQQALVVIVQNAIDQRLTDSSEGSAQSKLLERLQEITRQNELLGEQLETITLAAQKYKREATQLREKLEWLQEIDEKQRKQNINSGNQQSRQEIEQLKSINEILKQKLLQVVRQNEEELAKVREENIILHNKTLRFKQYESTVEQLKEQRERNQEYEQENKRLTETNKEKQKTIKQLKKKINQMNELNINMEVQDVTMKMQHVKNQYKFKNLQSQVNRLKPEAFPSNAPITPLPSTDAEELEILQEEVEKLRTSYRQLDRQNLKLKKKLQKTQTIEGEKKKLQKIILDISKSKQAQIEMLVVSLFDLRSQNIRIHELLKSK